MDKAELLESKLIVCENCEWCCYQKDKDENPKCLLNGEEKGLLENCNKFKKTTGHHFTIFY